MSTNNIQCCFHISVLTINTVALLTQMIQNKSFHPRDLLCEKISPKWIILSLKLGSEAP